MENTQPQPVNTIDDVLAELDAIIAWSMDRNDALGYFAYLYRRMTAHVKAGVRAGRFADNALMERLDVVFARRYIDACRQLMAGQPATRSWMVAFEARSGRITIIQHLLLGMNAHINLDLGIAAAEVAPPGKIQTMEQDFKLINQLLKELSDEMQERLSRASPLFFLLDFIGGRRDEAVINFSLEKARNLSWELACKLAALPEPAWPDAIDAADQLVARVGGPIRRPPGRLLPWGLRLVQWWEEKEVRRALEKLQA